ncbi:MAG: hypothetical protein OEW24_03820 [Chloroflexota bacterium]|nr:hypothetical protein [Chloroflexota bacterium]
MTDEPRTRLDRLTDRWRARHEASVASRGREPADTEREARARAHFPYQSETPAAYAARHAEAMIGYTYDAYTYGDPQLDAWLVELGRILRPRPDRSHGGRS